MSLTPRVVGRVAVAAAAALVVGPLSAGPVAAQQAPVEIQVVGINDFHGHLDPRAGAASVAGVLGGAVRALRAENPNTVFVSAGDNIGASPFISSSQQDDTDARRARRDGTGGVRRRQPRVRPRLRRPRGSCQRPGRLPVPRRQRRGRVAGPAVVRDRPDRRCPRRLHRGGDARDREPGLAGGHPRHHLRGPGRRRQPGGGGAVRRRRQQRRGRRAGAAGPRGRGDPAAAPTGATGGTAADCARIAQADDAFGDIVREVSPDVDAVLAGHTHLNVDCEIAGPGAAAASGPRGAPVRRGDQPPAPDLGPDHRGGHRRER